MASLYNDKPLTVEGATLRPAQQPARQKRISPALTVILSVVAYIALFVLFYYWHNFGMPVVAMLPVAVAAWAYGTKGGIAAALLSLPANIAMCQALGVDWMERMFKQGMGLEGTFGFIVAGIVIGRISDLGNRLQKELSLRQLVEAELKVHRDHLEDMVRSKTAELCEANQQLLTSNSDLSTSRNALKESQERFRAIAETTPEAIISTDTLRTIIYWNKAAEKMFGYSAQEIIGKSNDMLITVDEQVRQSLYSMHRSEDEMQTISGLRIESVAIRKDGTTFPASLAFTEWQAGSDIFITALVQDISERKKAEEQLKASRDFLSTIFKASPDIILAADRHGVISAVNDAVRVILGYEPDELIGQSTAMLMPEIESQRKPGLRMMAELLENGSTKDFEMIMRRKDGSACFIECNASMLKNGQDKAVGSICVLRDSTARKKTEEQLRQTLKMESIGTLAGGIAHDFNNILGGIIGYTELAVEDAAQGLSIQEHLAEVLTSSIRARDLIRQIMLFSRKNEQQKTPVRLSHIVAEALKLLRPTIPSFIDIASKSQSADDMVYADPIQLQQVIMNLCANAAYSMREKGGTLTLETSPVMLDAQTALNAPELPSGAYVKLTVRDTGTGMDPQIVNRIFEPFFTTKEAGYGTGMGLAVVHGIVKSHAGALQVESIPGKGTSMHVMLPRTEQSAEAASGKQKKISPCGTEHILFVDDEGALVDIACKMLTRLGYNVTALLSSTQALDVFCNNPTGFDLLITDQSMPDLPGADLVSRVLAIRPDLPVILCSGYNDLMNEQQALQQGCRAYLLKPLTREHLAETIRHVLDNQSGQLWLEAAAGSG